jgi:quinol monooxygenase YgiN
MLFQVILDLRVKAEHAAALKRWFDENLPETQACDGCVYVQALEHDSDPGRIVLIGLWENRPKWETYIKWRQDRGDFETLAPMLAQPPRFECYRQFGEWSNRP